MAQIEIRGMRMTESVFGRREDPDPQDQDQSKYYYELAAVDPSGEVVEESRWTERRDALSAYARACRTWPRCRVCLWSADPVRMDLIRERIPVQG